VPRKGPFNRRTNMKIEVLIEETRSRVVEIEAETLNDAIETVRDEYERGAHDLSLSEHIVDTSIVQAKYQRKNDDKVSTNM